jgi:catechol-2,3-dioxygenase
LEENKVAMEKSQYTVKKINSTEHDNFAQEDILGIHHVTAIANDPQQNIDFYTQVLGLRLVKLTVILMTQLHTIYILVTK